MFAFELALRLGYPHPDFLLRQITSRQLAEWMAWWSLEDRFDRRDDWRFGMLASINCRLAGQRTAKPSDFMPVYDHDRPARQTEAEMRAAFAIIAKRWAKAREGMKRGDNR